MKIRKQNKKEISSWENEGGLLSSTTEKVLFKKSEKEKIMVESSEIEKVQSRPRSFSKRMNSVQVSVKEKNKVSIVDREIGTLRGNYKKIKQTLLFLISYIKSFFTKEKADQIREVFSYTEILKKDSSHSNTGSTKVQ